MPLANGGEITLKGISGSPGICIGQAYLVDQEGIDIVEKYYIHKDRLQKEIKRFKTAVKKSRDELEATIADIPDNLRQHVDILETHKALYKDKMLYGKTIDMIKKDKINAEWALKKIVSDIKTMFENISEPYLKSRVTDIAHVSDGILRNLVGAEDVDISEIDKRVVLIAHDLSPADTSRIQLKRVKGFTTDLGGRTSHTAIIARTLNIPSVVGLDNITGIVKSDDIIIVDGQAGVIIIHPTDETIIHYQKLKSQYEEYRQIITRDSQRPAETADGHRLKIMANIELPEEVKTIVTHGGEGIGLYRTEFLYLSKNRFPEEEELFNNYRDVATAMAPGSVTIRTLDINGDKAISDSSDSDEQNPALGLRAIRFCLSRPDVFKVQLRAILRAAAFGNIKLLFPMISGYKEVIDAKKILEEASFELEKEGINFNKNIEVGIMIEIPSAVVIADTLAEIVDFFSIGTNDLTQYTMAIDRGNKKVANLFNPLHPAVIRMVKRVVDVGKEKGIDVIMCGEMAGVPFNIPVLLGIGPDALSMNPHSIPGVKKIISQLKVEECQEFVMEILEMPSVEEITALMEKRYGSIFSSIKYT
ncbi:MAG: phosphoenolpyruvate--protein phosphotransferase [Deltaproteobacteria bacterium]|nr:phosphoenolpyruvate--protein phosphotransferase [Deltaproteobacteria bacterium]